MPDDWTGATHFAVSGVKSQVGGQRGVGGQIASWSLVRERNRSVFEKPGNKQ